jgi:hypothetical protein
VATKAKVLCGTCEIPWDNVATVLSRWKENPESVTLNRRAYLKAMHLVEFRDRFQVKREPISLLDAMRWSYQTEATDPRDKIFASLGLCHDGATYVPVQNYKQPLEDIIADMSRAMVSYDRSLDLMCLKGRISPQEGGNFPSWMPNWVNLWSGSLYSMTLHESYVCGLAQHLLIQPYTRRLYKPHSQSARPLIWHYQTPHLRNGKSRPQRTDYPHSSDPSPLDLNRIITISQQSQNQDSRFHLENPDDGSPFPRDK